jgi:hypothetical protein
MSSREEATVASRRLLDPVERTAEILFGLIMVLTFTNSINVLSPGDADVERGASAPPGRRGVDSSAPDDTE